MTGWLALDIGTTGAKAALLDSDGRALRSSYRDYPTHAAEGGVAEQDVRDWWRAAASAAHELAAGELQGIVITGQMQDIVLLDAQGEPVRPVMLYSDSRAHAEAAALNESAGSDWLRELTGNDQGAGSLIARLRWLAAHESESLRRAAHLLIGAADAVVFRLTGRACSDTTTASTTGLMDLAARAWLSAAQWERCGVRDARALLGELVPGGAQVGAVQPAAAAEWGVRVGTPVFLAPGDAGAATLGAGSGISGRPYAYIGTSGWVAYTAQQPGSPENGVFTLAHPLARHTICVAPLLTAAGNLDWAKAVFGAHSHSQMVEAALAQPPARLLYLPYLNGERSPFSDPFARGAFIGLEAHHTQADLARAVLEGVAFAYRHALDSLIQAPVEHLVLTGGGTRSAGWCQMIADVCGVSVSIAPDAANVGLRGALLAARVARGDCADYSLPDTRQPGETLMPQAAPREHYQRQYAHFRAAYPALKALFAQMAAPG